MRNLGYYDAIMVWQMYYMRMCARYRLVATGNCDRNPRDFKKVIYAHFLDIHDNKPSLSGNPKLDRYKYNNIVIC